MVGGMIGLLLLNAFKNGLTVIGFSTYWQVVASGVLLIVALSVDYITTQSRIRALEKKERAATQSA